MCLVLAVGTRVQGVLAMPYPVGRCETRVVAYRVHRAAVG
jgi:hypothetical protein